ncbi:hypothetical protein DPX16_15976 [Anabarilius grahami]|uniref:Uncharacterized protein n=1 Tax=Anabarilius grahami TaxID=495550 RepID=A0A3N0YUJ7_ANAGA|nr:hypothetical protein DPX16_15976 [Anabarilius grahami]
MFRSARKPLRYPSIHLIAPCETGGLGVLGHRTWRLFVFEIKKIGEITKVNGFNDAFRNGATSATECQAAQPEPFLRLTALELSKFERKHFQRNKYRSAGTEADQIHLEKRKRKRDSRMFLVYGAEGGHSAGQQTDLPPAALTFALHEPEHLMTRPLCEQRDIMIAVEAGRSS